MCWLFLGFFDCLLYSNCECHVLYSPPNLYLIVLWILDFKYILVLSNERCLNHILLLYHAFTHSTFTHHSGFSKLTVYFTEFIVDMHFTSSPFYGVSIKSISQSIFVFHNELFVTVHVPRLSQIHCYRPIVTKPLSQILCLRDPLSQIRCHKSLSQYCCHISVVLDALSQIHCHRPIVTDPLLQIYCLRSIVSDSLSRILCLGSIVADPCIILST